MGCTLKSLNIIKGKDKSTRDHSRLEEELGWPEELAYLEDKIFEMLPIEEAKKWPLKFAKVKSWIGPLVDEIDAIRQDERERAQKIIEEIPIDMICEKENNCDCGDPLNCKWTKGHNYARGESRYWIEKWKQEALKKLNETV